MAASVDCCECLCNPVSTALFDVSESEDKQSVRLQVFYVVPLQVDSARMPLGTAQQTASNDR